MKILGHDPAGKPYSGSNAPYCTLEYKRMRNSICNGNRDFALAYKYRTLYKELSANRIFISLPKTGALAYRRLDFADIFQRILAGVPKSDYLISYFQFFMDCFNSQNTDSPKVIEAKCFLSKKKNRNNIQMALKDMEAACKQDMMKVLHTLQKSPSVLTPKEAEILGKFEDISRAVSVLSLLIKGMYISPLPEKIPQAIFDEARKEDSRLSAYYQPDKSTPGYQKKLTLSQSGTRMQKRAALNFVNERAIAVIVLRGWVS